MRTVMRLLSAACAGTALLACGSAGVAPPGMQAQAAPAKSAAALASDDERALAALEKACVLDPLNPVHWEDLAQALERQGQGERAVLMRRQADSLRTHDVGSDYALLADASAAPATTRALAARRRQALERDDGGAAGNDGPAGPEPRWPQGLARTEVVAVGAAMVELRRVAAPPQLSPALSPPSPATLPPSPATPPPSPATSPPSLASRLSTTPPLVAVRAAPVDAHLPVRLEISNGNGVTGMAAALARTMRGDDVKVVRLTNVRPFAVPVSRVEYQSDQQAEALALAARLGMTVTAPRDGQQRAQVRIVLGRDLLSPAVLRQRYLK